MAAGVYREFTSDIFYNQLFVKGFYMRHGCAFQRTYTELYSDFLGGCNNVITHPGPVLFSKKRRMAAAFGLNG